MHDFCWTRILATRGASDWFKTGNTTSPLTGVELESTSLIPNVLMRKVILSWRENEGAALVEAAKKGSNASNASSNGS